MSRPDRDMRDAPAVIAKIAIRAKVRRGASKEQFVGLELTLRADQTPEQIAADVTELCRNIRDEVSGILK